MERMCTLEEIEVMKTENQVIKVKYDSLSKDLDGEIEANGFRKISRDNENEI